MKPLILTIITMIILVIIGSIVTYWLYRKNSPPQVSLKPAKPYKITIYNLRYPFSLPTLKYGYKDLAPRIDEETLQIHHTKHHQAYIDNINKTLEEAPEYQKNTLEELLSNLDSLPPSIKERVRNNGGGHLNHTIFWELLSPRGQKEPSSTLESEIIGSFGSLKAFKEQFTLTAQKHVGSGWTWLCLTPQKTLNILATTNHNTPLEKGYFPILVLDLWEHAYYLKYRNKKTDFITAWWDLVDWETVETLFHQGLKTV